MDTTLALQIVGGLLVLALAGFLYFLYYAAYFYKVKVSTGPPIISEVKVAYKFHTGNYYKCGPFYIDILKICPDKKLIGAYYDRPDTGKSKTCRYIAGAIIAEGSAAIPDSDLVQKLRKNGYKFATFPKVDACVKSQHPFSSDWTPYFAVPRVYKRVFGYIQEKKLTAHPMVEVYIGEYIHYMVPLSKQEEFYVDEAKPILEERK